MKVRGEKIKLCHGCIWHQTAFTGLQMSVFALLCYRSISPISAFKLQKNIINLPFKAWNVMTSLYVQGHESKMWMRWCVVQSQYCCCAHNQSLKSPGHFDPETVIDWLFKVLLLLIDQSMVMYVVGTNPTWYEHNKIRSCWWACDSGEIQMCSVSSCVRRGFLSILSILRDTLNNVPDARGIKNDLLLWRAPVM